MSRSISSILLVIPTFVGEVISALRVADGAIDPGRFSRRPGSRHRARLAIYHHLNFRRFLVINKMDRENANFQKALASIQEYSEIRLIPVQLPWGEKADFQGVIDLLSMKALKGDGKSARGNSCRISSGCSRRSTHIALVEAAAEGDDALLEKYFDSGEH